MTAVRVAVLVVSLMLAARPAVAHSLLLASDPRADAVLTSAPSQIVLRFNNRIEKRLSRVRLVDEHGTAAAAATRAADGAAETLIASVPLLAPGAWRVEWQVFSTDGHVVSGSYRFRLAP